MSHDTTIREARYGSYWWACSCGDEGGPHETHDRAWDATVMHERASRPICRVCREPFTAHPKPDHGWDTPPVGLSSPKAKRPSRAQ